VPREKSRFPSRVYGQSHGQSWIGTPSKSGGFPRVDHTARDGFELPVPLAPLTEQMQEYRARTATTCRSGGWRCTPASSPSWPPAAGTRRKRRIPNQRQKGRSPAPFRCFDDEFGYYGIRPWILCAAKGGPESRRKPRGLNGRSESVSRPNSLSEVKNTASARVCAAR
jgi:hypothetical protein